MFRKENGVTLVALVITIIVLLILAGVTISMVMGDDSILDNAQTAKSTYNMSDIRGKADLASLTVRASEVAINNGGTGNHTVYNATEVSKAMTALFSAGEVTTAASVNNDAFTIGINGKSYTVTLNKTADDEFNYSVTVDETPAATPTDTP